VRLLKHGKAYVTQRMVAYEQTDRERVIQSLTRKAQVPGYKLLPTTDDAYIKEMCARGEERL
jgi:hypothetical protein